MGSGGHEARAVATCEEASVRESERADVLVTFAPGEAAGVDGDRSFERADPQPRVEDAERPPRAGTLRDGEGAHFPVGELEHSGAGGRGDERALKDGERRHA